MARATVLFPGREFGFDKELARKREHLGDRNGRDSSFASEMRIQAAAPCCFILFFCQAADFVCCFYSAFLNSSQSLINSFTALFGR